MVVSAGTGNPKPQIGMPAKSAPFRKHAKLGLITQHLERLEPD